MNPRDFCLWFKGVLDGVPIGNDWSQVDWDRVSDMIETVNLEEKIPFAQEIKDAPQS